MDLKILSSILSLAFSFKEGFKALRKFLQEKVSNALSEGYIPIVIGGGNDQSYPNASALLDHYQNKPIGVVNIDAHLDVRPLIDGQRHSGCPFRMLIEDERFKVLSAVEKITPQK